MLHELRVENLLLLDRAELRLAPGLNVLTGETGAGKTLLAQALDLLLGGRAGSGVVRPGAREAYVEGIFSLAPDETFECVDLIPAGAEEVVLARRVWPDGRTRAYICGRSATLVDLRELSSRLIAFYGQHEHRKLMLSSAQLDVLDAHCGPAQFALRERVRELHGRVRRLEAKVASLGELEGARERELDLLAFELEEIESVDPSEEEAEALERERKRLRAVEGLRSAAGSAAETIIEEGGACELLARGCRQMHALAGVDPELDSLLERVNTLQYEAQDVGAELRSYAGGQEGSPGRLEEVEERLQALARLRRKHGGSIAEVLGHAEGCRARIEELQHAEVALESTERELSCARAELACLAGELGDARARAAPQLSAAVRRRLAELAMPEARFEVELRQRPEGCGASGNESVEFLIAPNPGVPDGPLREIASGGELSRVMLALLSVAHGSESAKGARTTKLRDGPSGKSGRPLLVFDEVDAGIGGHTARVVGKHLRRLARGRQVLCITHLPQVAALAERHFTIAKDAAAVPARTAVRGLEGEAIVAELVRMLGGGEGDRAASQHARQLLRAA